MKREKRFIYLYGSFITAYARKKTITTSQSIQDFSIKKYGVTKYCYSDTDSIHCLLNEDELKEFCQIDDYKLGWWKLESHFTKAKFLRQKCYIEKIDGKLKVTCAGLPENLTSGITFDNFKTGFTVSGKLMFKHVVGGVLLVDTDFTIKEEKINKSIEKLLNL